MDEQRIQASYLELINQLLACPNGLEFIILEAHQELLSPRLVQMMKAMAGQMQAQGKQTNAWRLKNLAAQANVMGLSNAIANQSDKTSQANAQFFSEVLRCIATYQTVQGSIYQFFAANIAKFNADLLEAIPTITTKLLANAEKEWQVYVAALIGEFGNLITQFPLGQRAINMELAIEAYKQVLQVMTREAMPDKWAQTMRALATAYQNRIRGDRAQNIEDAITIYQQVLQVRTREAVPEDWAQSIARLALAYQNRIRGNRAQNIEQAIDAYKQALQVITRETMPDAWATSMSNLAILYHARIHGDHAQNIEDAITIYQQVLQVRTREAMPEEWAQSIARLALAYQNRIRGNRAQNIEQAIDAYKQALQVITRETMPDAWATSMSNLARAYRSRSQGDQAQNIEDAIETYQQVLQVRVRETRPHDWAQTMNSLAIVYSERIRGDRAQNIENAIEAYQQSLQVWTCETMPAEWASSMMNLAVAYYERIRGDRAQNIEDAIEAYQQSLQVWTREAMPADWATSMMNLALAYSKRIRGDRAQNIEDAIAIYQQSLQVMTRENMPLDWAQVMMNLALAYADRIRGDRAQNIEDAIEAYQQSLQVRTHEAMPLDWALSMMNLAIAYRKRIRGDRAQNIEDAIAACEQSLQVITCDTMPTLWAASMNTLGNAYVELIRGDRAQNIEDAIAAYQQSLQVRTREAMPLGWAESMMNLASAYQHRIRGSRAQNIEDAISAYQQSLQVRTREAVPVEWAQVMMNLANAYLERICGDPDQNIKNAIEAYQQALEVFQNQLLPNACRLTAESLGDIYADQQQWVNANASYSIAIDSAEILYQAALSRFSQEVELFDTNDLFRRAAFAQAKTGQLSNAVVTLERGRAKGLSESLERERADLIALKYKSPEVYHKYQRAIEAVHRLEVEERLLSSPRQEDKPFISETEFRQRSKKVRQELLNAVDSVRQCPGYETFLRKNSFDDIAATVKLGQPLVYLLTTSNGSLALIMHRSQLKRNVPALVNTSSIWLDTLTNESLQELLIDPNNEFGGWFGAYNNRNTNRDSWFQAIDQITHQLWTLIMEPVILHLQKLNVSHAVLIPTGFLSFLPLHAAWTEDAEILTGRRYALDTITFTYAPNARSMKAARVVSEDTMANSLLAINEPRPTSAKMLPFSEYEIEMATNYFQQSCYTLKYEQATREAALEAIPNYDVIHFSCHGYANPVSPLNSGLVMANDEVLSLRDIFNTNLQGVRLAILSACETGMLGTKLPDEVVSLPTGLLQAGVAGVIASLWSVAELSTMMLLVRFYDYWQNDKLEPVQALCCAQQWIKDTSNQEKEFYFKGFISENSDSRTLNKAASAVYQSLAFAEPDTNSLAHPFYWAAFTYVGA
ncbi:MAG: CHAT domain-containing protein [Cyanobacteria bacterium P01_D01_bin.56]